MDKPRFRIGFLASGAGTSVQVILDRIAEGQLAVIPSFLISNNSKSGAMQRAQSFGVPAFHVSRVSEGSQEAVGPRMSAILEQHPVDLLVLAGYMKQLPQAILEALPNRILNIHPSLLPSFGGKGFYGLEVHRAVLRRGCQYTGITIHLVNQHYDEGPIVLQKVVPVPPDCDPQELFETVLRVEHQWYWRVIQAFAQGVIPPVGNDPREGLNLSRFLTEMAEE